MRCLPPLFSALWLVLLAGCGGDDDLTPPELIEDPAVDTSCSPTPVAAGQSRAKRIACPDELPAGRLVSGRVGDVLLENARIKVVIRGFGEGYVLMGTKAGGIVDAARHGHDDLLKEVLPVFGLNGGGFDQFVITEAGDDGPATLVVRGPIEPVPFVDVAISPDPVPAIAEQRYILEPDTDELLIRTTLYPLDGGEATVTVGDAFFYGGLIDSWAPRKGLLTGSVNVEFIASTGGSTSYGMVYPATLAAVQYVDISNVRVGLGPSRTLGNPEPIDRWFVVGDGSASSITDRGYALRDVATGILEGTTAPHLEVRVDTQAGDPITIARADDAGNYHLVLPAGDYTMWTEAPSHSPGTAANVTITAGATETVDLEAGGSGTLSLAVVDGDGAAIPARVSLRAASHRVEYAGADGLLELGLPPGDYTLDVSRGMEYDAFTVDPLVITDGQTTSVDATLHRVVDTTGWIAMDPHIHSEMSPDSQITLDARLLAIAAEGVEVAISTDHDFVTDYSAVISELGLGDFVAAQCGVETSSLIWGHINTWPLVPDSDQPAGDAIPWYDRSPSQVFALMRERGDVVIQLNHPRLSDSGLLKIIEFDPDTLTARRDPAELGLPADTDLSVLDVDAVEVANSFSGEDFTEGLADWLAMVSAGHPAAITGSSDSHGRTAYIGGSRTYVYVGPDQDSPATVSLGAVNDALKARKAVVAQGAFVTAALIDPATSLPAAPGELVDLSAAANAQLAVKIQAPPWMPLDRFVVYAGNQIATTIDLDNSATEPVRYDQTLTLPLLDHDGFFVVHVLPAGPGSPVLGTPDGSVTNPARYDRDGDQDWTPGE